MDRIAPQARADNIIDLRRAVADLRARARQGVTRRTDAN
jgi:hypothetical protein